MVSPIFPRTPYFPRRRLPSGDVIEGDLRIIEGDFLSFFAALSTYDTQRTQDEIRHQEDSNPQWITSIGSIGHLVSLRF